VTFKVPGTFGVNAVNPNMPVMLTGRLAQGLGDGGLVALSLVSVIRLLPSTLVPRETARIVGTGIFAKCLPLAAIGLVACRGFVRNANRS